MLRQEEANVESFTEDDRRHYPSINQTNNLNQHHDSDDEDMYRFEKTLFTNSCHQTLQNIS